MRLRKGSSISGGAAGDWLAVVCLLACAGASAQETPAASRTLPSLDRVMVTEPPRPIPQFELTDEDGKPFRSSSLNGQPSLVFFGFAHCPDVCPAALSKLKLLHGKGGDLARTQVVFVSVDGERDTPQAVKAYLAPLSEDFIGLTGPPEKVRTIAASFAVAFFKDSPAQDGAYQVQHSSQIYLVDARGNLRAEFYDASIDTIETITRMVLEESAAAESAS